MVHRLALSLHRKKILDSNQSLKGLSDFLSYSKEMHFRLTGDSKLAVGVRESANGSLSRVYPAFPPVTANIASSPPRLEMDKWMYNCILSLI